MIAERRLLSLTPEEAATLSPPKPYLVVPGKGNACFSTDWSQGGPIIEREKMTTYADRDGTVWEATQFWACAGNPRRQYGPTPLVAAMRCYVASKLGDEVEIPDELK